MGSRACLTMSRRIITHLLITGSLDRFNGCRRLYINLLPNGILVCIFALIAWIDIADNGLYLYSIYCVFAHYVAIVNLCQRSTLHIKAISSLAKWRKLHHRNHIMCHTRWLDICPMAVIIQSKPKTLDGYKNDKNCICEILNRQKSRNMRSNRPNLHRSSLFVGRVWNRRQTYRLGCHIK